MKNKLLKNFIGVIDDRDEYQLQEIHKELAFSGILLWYLTMLLMFVSLIIDTMHNSFNYLTVLLLVPNMTYAIFVILRLRNKNLDDTECATLEEYEEKKKKLKRSAIISGMSWGVLMLILMEYIFPYLSTGNIRLTWQTALIWLVAGIFFGMTLYVFSKSKLKKHF